MTQPEVTIYDRGRRMLRPVGVWACPQHYYSARAGAELTDALRRSSLTARLDSHVILWLSAPRRYGGGAGAGLQLNLAFCPFCC